MKFTLTLNDYLEQYLTNMKQHSMHCPVCYKEEMCDVKSVDLEHILDCYRGHLLETHISRYKLENAGDTPSLSSELVLKLLEQVQLEMELYCLKSIDKLKQCD